MMIQYWIESCVDGSYYWRIVSANGEILAHSEMYATKWNARRAAKRIAKLTGMPWYDELRDENGVPV
jgi:uncharacterized protein YegP (UPF0339 family)